MFAPVEGPQSSPSSRAARAAIAKASASGTAKTSSKSSAPSSGGQKPTPPPSMWCVPGAALRDHRRLAGLDHGSVDARNRAPERARDAEEAAGRADVGAEGVESPVELLGELDAELRRSRRSCPCC